MIFYHSKKAGYIYFSLSLFLRGILSVFIWDGDYLPFSDRLPRPSRKRVPGAIPASSNIIFPNTKFWARYYGTLPYRALLMANHINVPFLSIPLYYTDPMWSRSWCPLTLMIRLVHTAHLWSREHSAHSQSQPGFLSHVHKQSATQVRRLLWLANCDPLFMSYHWGSSSDKSESLEDTYRTNILINPNFNKQQLFMVPYKNPIFLGPVFSM